MSGFNSDIEFKNVSFRYKESEKLVLDDINIKINKNERIAVVGLSGTGKSTLVDLLPRFYDVSSGSILVDGKEIRNIKINSLRSLFSIVTQEIILFNDTIKNNISCGNESIPMEKVIEAAVSANAHDFIMQTENVYQTLIGEGLQALRRPAPAAEHRPGRAQEPAHPDPREATSALDSESEKLVQEALFNLMKNRTSLIIAHRLSTIQHADEILLVQEGQIVERRTAPDDRAYPELEP